MITKRASRFTFIVFAASLVIMFYHTATGIAAIPDTLDAPHCNLYSIYIIHVDAREIYIVHCFSGHSFAVYKKQYALAAKTAKFI